MIRWLLVDAGGTLIAPSPSVGTVYAATAAKFGMVTDPAVLENKFRSVWKQHKTADTNITKNWWRSVVRDVFAPEFNVTDDLFQALFDAFGEPAVWKVFPDVRPGLDRLRSMGITLAIASNWDRRLPALLSRLGLASFFHHQFVSEIIGAAKPDPSFFQECLRAMNAEPQATGHVGDDPREDIAGAEEAGIRGFLLDRNGTARGEKRVNNLLELADRLSAMD